MAKKNAVLFIFLTLVLDVIGFGIVIPVFPKLLAEIKGLGIAEASKYGGYLLFAFAVSQFIFSPLVGGLSDKFGRRPVLLMSLFVFGIDYLVLVFANSYWMLMVARIVAGISGASFTTANAYIADISTDEDRAKNFGMVGAAFGIGFIVGPLLGGVLSQYGVRVPFFAAAGLSLLNFLYGYFILPESLPIEKRRNLDIKRLNPISSILKLGTYDNIRWLILAYFLLYLGSHAVQSNWTYYTMFKFDWSEKMVGYSLALVGLLAGLVQAVLAQKIGKAIGINRTLIIGFALYTIGMFLFAFANSTTAMMLILLPYCLGGIAMPNLISSLVKSVPPNEQGELQGALTSIISVSTIIGPLLMTSTFAYFTSKNDGLFFPGAPFVLGGIFMLISLIVVIFSVKKLAN
jgi:MFS transporter, DHA1 family, tetracycline resistance protein